MPATDLSESHNTQSTQTPASWAARWAAPLALVPALAGFSIAGESAPDSSAPVPDHAAAVTEFGMDAWKAVQPAVLEQKEVSARHWNDIEAVMLAADNAGIHEIQPIREAIINAGVTNAEIPARLVHAALYSSAEYVTQMSIERNAIQAEIRALETFKNTLDAVEGELPEDAELPGRFAREEDKSVHNLKQQTETVLEGLRAESNTAKERIDSTGSTLAKAAIPFLGKVIVDSESSTGVSTRVLIAADDAGRFSGREGITVYAPDGFDRIASYVIGRAGTEAEFNLVLNELKQTDLRTERAELLFDVFLYANARSEAAGLTGHIHEMLFRAPEVKKEEGLKLKLVEGVPTIITVPPTDKMKKALGPLERVDKSLLRNTISDPFVSDPTEQMAYAKGMLYLARQNHPAALAAIGQWYTLRATKSSVAAGVDEVMLEALGEVSPKSKKGFDLLLHVAAGNAKVMGYMLEAPLAINDTAQNRAGRNFIAALRSNPAEASQWIRDVADGKAETLLKTPATRSERDKHQELQRATRGKALEMMTYLDTRGTFVDYMRKIVANPFAGSRSSSDMKLAIIGLAMQRDAESVPLLLAKSADPSLSDSLRSLSLAAALAIDTPDIIPEATREAVAMPFSHANLLRYAPQYNHETGERYAEADVSGRLSGLMQSENPFRGRVLDRYAEWSARTEAQINGAENSGSFPDELSREDRLKAFLEFERQETGRTGSLFSVLRTDESLNRQVAKPLVDYLRLHRDERRHIDINDAQLALEVLTRAGITEAQDIVIDMVKDPKLFVSEDVSKQSGFMLSMQASNIMQLKASAIEALGGVVELGAEDDEAARILHTVARKESSSIFRDAALAGLNRLADRYEAAMAADGADVATLIARRDTHGTQTTGHLLHHAKGLDQTGQIRLRALDRNFAFARAADRLGGTSDLVLAANKAAGDSLDSFRVNSGTETDISLRPDIVRSVMHAMISNGRTVADIKALDLEPDAKSRGVSLFQFVDNEVYWLGNEGERRYTGEGTNIVVLDAGYVYGVPMVKGLGDRVLYPEGLEGYDPVQRMDFESAHPTAVAATAYEKAPDATIHSYNAWGGLREVPFRPEDVQGEVIRALEHIVERQVRGEVDFDAINYSFSYSNYALANEAFREELLDLTGAYIELASKVGIKHSISAGNSRGDSPASVRYGGLGEVNSLGLRFADDKQYEQPDGVFIAGAQDAFAGARLAEFTSSGDTLQPANGLRVISFDGTNVLLPWVDGKWVLMPINGTSFAAPNQEAMIAWAEEAFEKAGVTPSMQEWRTLMNSSKIQMPHYDDYEGGAYFHVASFMKEISKVIERHK